MTGYSNHNYDEFARVEELLSPHFQVLNPALNFNSRTDLPYDWYIREDLKLMAFADVLVLLQGWEYSRGAILEVHAAWILDMPIYILNNHDELIPTFSAEIHESLIRSLVSRAFWTVIPEKAMDDEDSD